MLIDLEECTVQDESFNLMQAKRKAYVASRPFREDIPFMERGLSHPRLQLEAEKMKSLWRFVDKTKELVDEYELQGATMRARLRESQEYGEKLRLFTLKKVSLMQCFSFISRTMLSAHREVTFKVYSGKCERCRVERGVG